MFMFQFDIDATLYTMKRFVAFESFFYIEKLKVYDIGH